MQIRNIRISEKLNAALEEDLQYRADELVDLGEEILMQVSALGICLYLKEGKDAQKEQFNDYILNNLFFNEKHQNAGPVFKMVMHMLNGIKESDNPFLQLFRYGNEINDTLIGLQQFRNSLMHGFFVLPADTNEAQTERILQLLRVLTDLGFFEFKAEYHFWNEDGFSGHWTIAAAEEWQKLQSDTMFGKLAARAIFELYNPLFTKIEKTNIATSTDKIQKYVENGLEGALAVFFHPTDRQEQDIFFKSTYSLLDQKKDSITLAFEIHEDGIAHSSSLLLKYLDDLLPGDKNEKNIRKRIEKNRKNEINSNKSIFVLVNNIHVALYSPDHLINLIPFLQENNINLIGIGYEYELLSQCFSHTIDFRNDKNILPDTHLQNKLVHNQLRHRGPYQGDAAYDELLECMELICSELQNGNTVLARRYADDKGIGIEIIEEVFSILYPSCKYDHKKNKFISDKVHELYEYPTELTETSSIYLSMGRRDIKLEYLHKSLSI